MLRRPPFTFGLSQVALKLPDYKKIVKTPMDLGTIEHKLTQRSSYASPGEFVEDVRLVWANARLYNPRATIFHQAACHLCIVFERLLWHAVKPVNARPRLSSRQMLDRVHRG